MKTFKFGQLLSKGDVCDRKKEIGILNKICRTGGRAVVYGSRRFGKTSVVKNVIMADYLENDKKSLALYADLLQVDSMEDAAGRLQGAFEEALSKRAKIKAFINNIHNYIKHFRVEISADPLSGAPTISLTGAHIKDERSLSQIFAGIKNFSEEYNTLLILDEFQDVKRVAGLEALLRSEIQNLNRTAVILLGSKRHILREIFHDESNPFYGFGVDIEFKDIPLPEWVPYVKERFEAAGFTIEEEGVFEICRLLRNVPNSVQELCQWITLSGESGHLDVSRIHKDLAGLIDNKSSRYMEKLAEFSTKEKKVLIALAQQEPVTSVASTRFVQLAGVSATAIKATVLRFVEQGVLDQNETGYLMTDPIFRLFLLRKFAHSY